MFELRNQVVVNWQAINNPFSDVHHGNAILHMICQEGYYEMVSYASVDSSQLTRIDLPTILYSLAVCP